MFLDRCSEIKKKLKDALGLLFRKYTKHFGMFCSQSDIVKIANRPRNSTGQF